MAVRDSGLRTGVEITLLIEDLVVGQFRLTVDGADRAIGDQCSRVVNARPRVFRKADHDVRPADLVAYPLQRRFGLQPESAVKQQILRRITRQRQLGKQHEVCAHLGVRTPRARNDPLGISVHVADQQIELRERNPE